ncbi:MAG: hypothetical protein QXX91_01750 [Thermoplasmata archaeon]
MTEQFRCEICNRNFINKEALDMHNNSKHYNKSSPYVSHTNKRKIRNWIIFLVAILIVAGLAYVLAFNSDKKDYTEFAKCLTENNVKMYGAYWCSHCKDQKKMFGKSWQYVNYVECSLPNAAGQKEECIKEGIDGYPTWDFNGTKVGGILTLEQLSDKTGCTLPA